MGDRKDKIPEQAAEDVKKLARRIREDSARIRDIVKTLHTSGAIEELAIAIRGAAIATKDTSREINETVKELNELGIRRREEAAHKTKMRATKRTTRKKVTRIDKKPEA